MGCGASAGKYESDDDAVTRDSRTSQGTIEPAVRKVFAIPKEEADAIQSAKSNPDFGARHSLNRKRAETEKTVVPEMLQSEHAGPLPAGEFHDCKWHKQHCSDKDLQPACSIRQAYPVDDADRKMFEKKERCWSPDDAAKPRHWGTVSVQKEAPRKLSCCKCGKVVADRHPDQYCGDHPFMFCLRCRKEGKHYFVLCIPCYNGGALATGPRAKVDAAEVAGEMSGHSVAGRKHTGDSYLSHHSQSPARKESNYSHGSDHASHVSERDDLRPTSSTRRGGTRNGSKSKAHGKIPSGRWTGQYYEGASGRQAERKIQFCQDGQIHGEGANCTLNGSIDGTRVMWTETHDWGSMKIVGEVDFTGPRPSISGKFTASDGGGGQVELKVAGK